MKRMFFVALIILMSSGAYATNGNNGHGNGGCGNGQQTNGCGNSTPGNTYNQGGDGGNGYGGQGGNGTGVGIGVGLGGIANANSAAEAKANAAAIAAQEQKQGQAQGQQQQTNVDTNVANVVKSTGGKASIGDTKTGDITISGDTVERSAPPVFAGNIPTTRGSCRLYMFGGGTNRDGAVSGSIPLGNDQTCLTNSNIANMAYVNSIVPDTFTGEDFIIESCKVEGMEDHKRCQSIKK